MFSFNTKSCLVTGIVLCELLGWQIAEARVIGRYYYALNAEDRSDSLNDEVSSILGLEIRDNLISPKSQTKYELESKAIYDHDNNVTNEQYTGFFNGEYAFVPSSLRWNYFGEVDVIPLDTGIEIDNLSSQNLSTVSTGPTISMWKNLRGSVDFTVLSSLTNYSESNLDSKEEDVILEYIYPHSKIMSTSYSLNYKNVNYDDASNASDDYELLTAGVTINRKAAYSNLEFTIEHGDLENNNITSPENIIELVMDYQVNVYSNISIELSDSLQSAADFNRLDGNPDNSIFNSGLVRNERIQLAYEHATHDTRYRFQIFSNQIENIFDAVVTSGSINGAIFSLSTDITDELKLVIGLESTDDELRSQRSDEFLIITTYTRKHSNRLYSELGLTLENDRVNNFDSNDTTLHYRITSRLF